MVGRDEGMTEQECWKQTRREKGLKWAEAAETEGKRQKTEKETRHWGTDFTLARPSAMVWYEPPSAGVRLGWTHLTRVTPCPSNCGAAQSLCAHYACELTLTHLVIHRGKAWPSSVICRSKAKLNYDSLFPVQTQWKTTMFGSRSSTKSKEKTISWSGKNKLCEWKSQDIYNKLTLYKIHAEWTITVHEESVVYSWHVVCVCVCRW